VSRPSPPVPPEGGSTGAADGARVAVGFAAVARACGLSVPVSAVVTFARALAVGDLGRQSFVYEAGLATLVVRPEDRAPYDEAFRAFFLGETPLRPLVVRRAVSLVVDDDEASSEPPADDDPEGVPPERRVVRFSRTEVLRHRDFGTLTADERAEAAQIIRRLGASCPLRPARRLRPAHRPGRLDVRRSVRAAMAAGGEPIVRAWRAPGVRPRRLVLLVDISGSMEPYARMLVRFAQATVAAGAPVEVFSLGTRCTRLTRELAGADPEAALARAARAVVDWSGGTRLGDGLETFNARYGLRGLARQAIVVVLSDGWDRGDPALLGREMERLSRVAHRIVWVNPLKASPGYAPLARGMAAALPFVDCFLEGHSLASLEELTRVLAAGPERPGARGAPASRAPASRAPAAGRPAARRMHA